MFILKSLTSHYHLLIKTKFQNKQLKYLNVDKIYNLMLRNIEKIHIKRLFNVRYFLYDNTVCCYRINLNEI